MRKILNFQYGLIHATYWMYYAIVGSFASVYLLDKGYGSEVIGMVLAIGCIIAVFIQPFIADLGDRSKRISVFGITGIIVSIMLVGTVLLFFFQSKSVGLTVIFIGLVAWVTALQPLFNYMAFKLSTSGFHINFGLARSGGSLGYSLLCIYLGNLVERRGVMTIPMAGVIILIALLTLLFVINRRFRRACAMKGKDLQVELSVDSMYGSVSLEAEEEIHDVAVGIEAAQDITLLQFISGNKIFLLLNIGVIFVFFNNGVLNSFMYQVVTNAGGSSTDMGAIFSLMAFCEIPTLVYFDKLKDRFTCQSMLKLGSIAFILKITCFFFAKDTTMMYVAQAFQPIAFALFLPAMIHLTDQVMKPGEAVKGQALFTIMMSISTVVSSLFGGIILERMGVEQLLFVSVLTAVFGALIVFIFVGKVPERKVK